MSARKTLFGSSAADEWSGRARRQPESELDVTPMIDVTFLLLIFFMVTSTMQQPDLDIPPARHGVGIDARGVMLIQVQKGPPPRIVLGDNRNAGLDEVRQRVEEAVRENRPKVIIRADGQIPHGFVQQVTRTVAEVGAAEFSIGVRDKTRP